jgi:hypothetical protein
MSEGIGIATKVGLSTTAQVFGHVFGAIGIGFGIYDIVSGAQSIQKS